MPVAPRPNWVAPPVTLTTLSRTVGREALVSTMAVAGPASPGEAETTLFAKVTSFEPPLVSNLTASTGNVVEIVMPSTWIDASSVVPRERTTSAGHDDGGVSDD